RFRVAGDAFGAEFAADAGGLVAAERRAEIDDEAVHVVRAGADLGRDLVAALLIGRPHRPRQAVLGRVGDADRVVLVLVGNRDEDRAEDLLARDLHLVPDVGEERRFDVPAAGEIRRPTAAD